MPHFYFSSFSGYGFVEFLSEEDADYAIKIMNMIKLYGKPIRVNKASAHNKNLDVGANIFIGNLDPEIDEKLLYDTFSAFGVILQTPKIMRDPDTGNSKGYAFINFASFDASDAAIEAMNGQYLCNRPITVSYAFKKDSKGERHGSAAERLLAAQNPLSQADRPHQLFADAPPPPSAPTPVLTSMGAGMPMPGMTDFTGWTSEGLCLCFTALLYNAEHFTYCTCGWERHRVVALDQPVDVCPESIAQWRNRWVIYGVNVFIDMLSSWVTFSLKSQSCSQPGWWENLSHINKRFSFCYKPVCHATNTLHVEITVLIYILWSWFFELLSLQLVYWLSIR